MADSPISGLTDGGTIQTTDEIGVNRSGANFRVVVGALAPKATVDTAEIDDDAVTLAKIAAGTANRLLGNDGAGDPSEISIAGDAALAAGTLTVTTEVSTDTTPVLGGDLDMNANALVTLSNADVLLSPNGTGAVSVSEVTNYEDNVTADDDIPNKKFCDDTYLKPLESFIIAASDKTTSITTGTNKSIPIRMPYAFVASEVRANVDTAPTGAAITIDINEDGTTILSTKLTIDATETTSTTAAVAAVISDANLADDAEITIDFDVVGSTEGGVGVVVSIIGNQA